MIGILENRFRRLLAAVILSFLIFFLLLPFLPILNHPISGGRIFHWEEMVYSVSNFTDIRSIALFIICACGIYIKLGKTVLPCVKRKPHKSNSICVFFLFYSLCNVSIVLALCTTFIAISNIGSSFSIIALLVSLGLFFVTDAALRGGFNKIANRCYKKIFGDPLGMAVKNKAG